MIQERGDVTETRCDAYASTRLIIVKAQARGGRDGSAIQGKGNIDTHEKDEMWPEIHQQNDAVSQYKSQPAQDSPIDCKVPQSIAYKVRTA
jgi:hypothetical protein